jgi:glutamate-5-semialdehyde dehydrogenase
VEQIAAFRDPVGAVLDSRVTEDGLKISKVSVPLGAIFFIYESRPNVTIDGAALCLKAGDAVILRGGKESLRSCVALANVVREALEAEGITPDAVRLVDRPDHEIVSMLLKRGDALDVVIPRGGERLIRAVVEQSVVPVLKHYKGICHIYVDKDADMAKVLPIVVNAKAQRPSVCNAMETLLVDRALGAEKTREILDALKAANVEIVGDEEIRKIDPSAGAATDEDWDTEYLALKLSAKVVDGVDGAIAHIEAHSSGHTESILTENAATAEKFLARVDSSSVMHNASTRFSDGGMYGLGAEVGISTDKLHARGPMGVDSLTSYKWVVRGNGQIRK